MIHFARTTLVCLSLLVHLPQPAPGQGHAPALFLFENGSPSQFSIKGDTLGLKQGSGWIRTRRAWNDFVLTADFRLVEPGTTAEVGIRTLTAAGRWPQCGYGLNLSSIVAAGTLVGKRVNVRVVQFSVLPPVHAGEWHSLIVKAEGQRVTTIIDGEVASISEIEHRFGSVSFHVTRGAAEFRAVTVRPLPLLIQARDTDDPTLRARVEQPHLIRQVKPRYTESAFQRKVEGTIEFRIVILEDGTVGAVIETKRGDPDLEQAGMAAVANWLFTPAKLDGKPIAAFADVELTFTLK